MNSYFYGAGLYSFFNNNDNSCSGNGVCQNEILSIENSKLGIYNLNTVASQNMITINGADAASKSDNRNGFIDTIALFNN